MNGGTEPGKSGAQSGAKADAKKSSVLALFKAVAWSFLGVRKRADLEADAALHPVALIIAGLVGAALFVGVLLLVVRAVVG